MKNESNNKAKLKKYTKLIQLVKDIIDQWDPIELLPFCPPDEYDMEIECIATLAAKDIDTDTLAVEIQAVFQKYFGSDTFTKEFDECLNIAKTLKQKLQEDGLN